jgi:hypothetical protein
VKTHIHQSSNALNLKNLTVSVILTAAALMGFAPAIASAATYLSLTANPTQVASGASTTLSWTATNVQSCSASGGWSGTKGTSGAETQTNITANKTYTLTCTGAGSSATISVLVTVSIPLPPPPPTAGVCNGFYPAGFQLVQGQDNHQPSSLAKPTKGMPFADQWYDTCVVRVTDHANEPPVGFARNDYSRRQPFNADSSKFLVYSHNGFWHLYDAESLAYIKQLSGPGGDAEPQWHPTNPDLLYYLPTNGGMHVYELNVVTDQRRTVGNFTGRLPWAGAVHVWTKSEGSPSADGRYWGFMVDDGSWNSLGLFTWDMQTDTILGTYATGGDRPDHVSMSLTGQYLVASWGSTRGTVSFSRDFSTSRQLQSRTEHSDLALDTNGDDVYVSVDYAISGQVFMTNLRTGVRTNLFATYIDGTATALHISGKAANRPGWVLVSTYAPHLPAGATKKWLHDKIFAVALKANPRILNIAHHHGRAAGYWTEPHAAVNRDFTKILFNSNWETSSGTDIDAYLVELPSGIIPAN